MIALQQRTRSIAFVTVASARNEALAVVPVPVAVAQFVLLVIFSDTMHFLRFQM